MAWRFACEGPGIGICLPESYQVMSGRGLTLEQPFWGPLSKVPLEPPH